VTAFVRLLTPADIPAALRITQAAGWNQTDTDWHNLLRLAPETCFGLESDGILAATATALCYQRRLAWIGMVLTDPAHRRRGFAQRLMEHSIAALTARQVEWIKLDATKMGEPLYRQLGFETECEIERWGTTASPASGVPDLSWHNGWSALDRQAFGADRSHLRSMLAPMGAAAVPGQGYVLARPGSQAAYFGPCVSRRADTARPWPGMPARKSGSPPDTTGPTSRMMAARPGNAWMMATGTRSRRLTLSGPTGASGN